MIKLKIDSDIGLIITCDTVYDQSQLEELKESIEQHGLEEVNRMISLAIKNDLAYK